MIDKNPIVAIDIGSQNIVIAIANPIPDSSDFEVSVVTQTPSAGVHKGCVVDIDQAVAAIQKAVKEVAGISGYRVKQAYVSIGGRNVWGENAEEKITIRKRSVSAADLGVLQDKLLSESVDLKGMQHLQLINQTYLVDGKATKNPVGMAGSNLEQHAHLVYVNQDEQQNLLNCFNRCNIKVNGMYSSGIVSSMSCLTESEKKNSVILVDFGAETTSIVIYRDGMIVHSACLPVGSWHITHDIAEVLHISEVDAEDLKFKYGLNAGAEQVNTELVHHISGIKDTIDLNCYHEIVALRFNEIIGLIKHHVNQTPYAKHIRNYVFTGGGALLQSILHGLEENFVGDYSVRIAVPLNGDERLSEIWSNPICSTCLGIVKQVMEERERNGKASMWYFLLGRVKKYFSEL